MLEACMMCQRVCRVPIRQPFPWLIVYVQFWELHSEVSIYYRADATAAQGLDAWHRRTTALGIGPQE